jgi:hypothetical protein
MERQCRHCCLAPSRFRCGNRSPDHFASERSWLSDTFSERAYIAFLWSLYRLALLIASCFVRNQLHANSQYMIDNKQENAKLIVGWLSFARTRRTGHFSNGGDASFELLLYATNTGNPCRRVASNLAKLASRQGRIALRKERGRQMPKPQCIERQFFSRRARFEGNNSDDEEKQ